MNVCGTNSAEFPASATAGLTFSASVALPDYPAPEWSVSAILRGAGVIDLSAVSEGSTHTFSMSAANTADWISGGYWGVLRATNGIDIVDVGNQFQFSVVADLASATAGYDGRSESEIALDAINALLGKRATLDQNRYKINDRELWRMTISELLKLKSFYTSAVRRERRKASGCANFGRAIPVKF